MARYKDFKDFIEKFLLFPVNEETNQLNVLILKGLSAQPNGISDYFIFPNKDEINKYNDMFVCLINKELVIFNGTTDPGLYYLKNPLTQKGTAHLAYTQHRFVIGLHRKKEKALRAKNELVWLIRDFNRDMDFNIGDTVKLEKDTGVNIHRMNGDTVGKWSAGCAGLNDRHEWDRFINLADKSSDDILVTVWRGRDYLNYVNGQAAPTLYFGCIQSDVARICNKLLIQDHPSLAFNDIVFKEVCKFQAYKQLKPDGIVGPKTWKCLYED